MTELSERRAPSDLWPWTVLAVAGGTALLVVVVLGALALVWREMGFRPPSPRHSFPAPRLQVHPVAELRRFEAAQQAEMNAYVWVDRERGLARIPVERAMAQIAARGMAGYEPVEAGQ